MHHGHCGHNRFFDPIKKRCVTTASDGSLEICNAFDVAVDSSTSSTIPPKLEKMLLLQQKGPRVVCYVTSWALYRKGDGQFVPEHLDGQLCTDIVYAFAGLNPDNLLVQPFDPWADIDNSKHDST